MNFLEQFELLRQKTPRAGLQCVQNENSPYCQYTEKSKNCYMTFASYQSEDCIYNHRLFYCRDCADCTMSVKCELCFECVDCQNCYNCDFCMQCENTIDSYYSFDCVGCNNCFGCVGLRRKKFYIFNKEFSKEEYFAKIAELRKKPADEIYGLMSEIYWNTPRIAVFGKNNEGSFGDNIHNCKDSYWIFDSFGLRDCFYMYFGDDSKDLYDCTHLGWSEMCYEIMSGGNLNNCSFCSGSWFSSNLEYCDLVYNSHDCFGCASLNHAQYRILNVPYEKEEYFARVAEIKEQMKKDGTHGKWFNSTYPEVLTYGY
ncbi:MAG: hypothetical protein WCT53_01970 [Candidatus Gracilibacteria bacterium]